MKPPGSTPKTTDDGARGTAPTTSWIGVGVDDLRLRAQARDQ